MSLKISGGSGLKAFLTKVSNQNADVKAGFFADARYDDGTSVAKIAIQNEFGGTIKVPAHEQTVYRKVGADGEFANDGKFVKKTQANFASTHTVPEHTITIPARPFMSDTIKLNKSKWFDLFVEIVNSQKQDINVAKAFQVVGNKMVKDIKKQIINGQYVDNAPSTKAKKGENKGTLRDSDVMLNAVNYEVKE